MEKNYFLSLKAVFTKPVDDSNESFDIEEVRKNPTPKQKVFLFAIDNFTDLVKDYASKSYEVAQKILKDESLMESHNEEAENVKSKLQKFVNNYETTKDKDNKFSLVEIYNDVTEHYYDMPESKQTVNTTFILNLLKKYDARSTAVEFYKQFLVFNTNFLKMYEETKANLDKPMVEWFEKYKTIVDHEKQIDAFDSFWELAD